MRFLKRILAVALALIMALGYTMSLGVYASTANLRYFERGILSDGENYAYYVLDKDNKTIYLTGDGSTNGHTPTYPDASSSPLAGRSDVTCIVIEEDVEYVGDYVFANMKSVDTLEVQSNLLSSSSNMSGKALSGCTSLRHIRGESSFLSTDVMLQVVKGAVNIASGNWLSLIANGINIVKEGVSEDSLSNEVVHAMVNDYIMTGEEIFLGDLDAAVAVCQAREQEVCYWDNQYHHQYQGHVSRAPSCTMGGELMHVCSVCGSFYVEDYGYALGHDYVSETLYEPSCIKEGVSKDVCSRCGDIKLVSIPAKGHTNGRWRTLSVPEQSQSGYVQCFCADCGEPLKTVNVSIFSGTLYKYKVGLNPSDNTALAVAGEYERENYASSAVRETTVLGDDEPVGTGCKIYVSYIPRNQVSEIYTVILYGDLDGDGIIGTEDYSILSGQVYGTDEPMSSSSVLRRAADLNRDGVLDAFDLSLLDLQISGSKAVNQSA